MIFLITFVYIDMGLRSQILYSTYRSWLIYLTRMRNMSGYHLTRKYITDQRAVIISAFEKLRNWLDISIFSPVKSSFLLDDRETGVIHDSRIQGRLLDISRLLWDTTDHGSVLEVDRCRSFTTSSFDWLRWAAMTLDEWNLSRDQWFSWCITVHILRVNDSGDHELSSVTIRWWSKWTGQDYCWVSYV